MDKQIAVANFYEFICIKERYLNKLYKNIGRQLTQKQENVSQNDLNMILQYFPYIYYDEKYKFNLDNKYVEKLNLNKDDYMSIYYIIKDIIPLENINIYAYFSNKMDKYCGNLEFVKFCIKECYCFNILTPAIKLHKIETIKYLSRKNHVTFQYIHVLEAAIVGDFEICQFIVSVLTEKKFLTRQKITESLYASDSYSEQILNLVVKGGNLDIVKFYFGYADKKHLRNYYQTFILDYMSIKIDIRLYLISIFDPNIVRGYISRVTPYMFGKCCDIIPKYFQKFNLLTLGKYLVNKFELDISIACTNFKAFKLLVENYGIEKYKIEKIFSSETYCDIEIIEFLLNYVNEGDKFNINQCYFYDHNLHFIKLFLGKNVEFISYSSKQINLHIVKNIIKLGMDDLIPRPGELLKYYLENPNYEYCKNIIEIFNQSYFNFSFTFSTESNFEEIKNIVDLLIKSDLMRLLTFYTAEKKYKTIPSSSDLLTLQVISLLPDGKQRAEKILSNINYSAKYISSKILINFLTYFLDYIGKKEITEIIHYSIKKGYTDIISFFRYKKYNLDFFELKISYAKSPQSLACLRILEECEINIKFDVNNCTIFFYDICNRVNIVYYNVLCNREEGYSITFSENFDNIKFLNRNGYRMVICKDFLKELTKYFLPYQIKYIRDNSVLK